MDKIRCVVSENGTIIPIHNIAVISAKNASHYIWSNADADDSNGGHKLSNGQYNALLRELEFICDKYNIRGIKSKHAEGKLGEMIKEMKSPEESLGISSKEYNDIVDECLYGESKSSDKVEPKFKIEKGKWYVCIKDLLDNYANKAFRKGDTYLSTQDESLIPSNSNVPFEVVCPDTYFRDWTIQDAKPGDILAVEPENDYPSPFIAIYKERGLDFFNSHCFISFDGKFNEGATGHSIYHVHPATKEQRDTLMKAMADAGYTFDFEKKMLKKIEQKPAEWSEDDEVKINRIVACLKNLNVADNDILLKDVDWLKSIKSRVQPKREWSKEDEDIKQSIIDILTRQGFQTQVDWFKSLKDRVQSQPKQKWSEEDEEVLNLIIARLHSHPNVDLEEYSKEYDWLNYNPKSLRHQKQWKPSEEQMGVIEAIINNRSFQRRHLDSLYEQLKKLKGE